MEEAGVAGFGGGGGEEVVQRGGEGGTAGEGLDVLGEAEGGFRHAI